MREVSRIQPVIDTVEGKEVAMPLEKTRVLPDWMVGAAERTGIAHPETNLTDNAKTAAKTGKPAGKAVVKPVKVPTVKQTSKAKGS